MPETRTITVYRYDELDGKAKRRAMAQIAKNTKFYAEDIENELDEIRSELSNSDIDLACEYQTDNSLTGTIWIIYGRKFLRRLTGISEYSMHQSNPIRLMDDIILEEKGWLANAIARINNELNRKQIITDEILMQARAKIDELLEEKENIKENINSIIRETPDADIDMICDQYKDIDEEIDAIIKDAYSELENEPKSAAIKLTQDITEEIEEKIRRYEEETGFRFYEDGTITY